MASYRLAKRFYGRHVWLNGYNGAGGSAEEDIWDYSAVWTPIATTGVTLEVASSSTSDTAAGTGAQSVRVYGIDPNGVPQIENFTLNGQTEVAGTKTWYRVWGVEVLTAGSGKANAGVIYVADSATAWSSGVPSTTTAIQATIAIGINVSRLGWFTPPAAHAYFLRDLFLGNATAAATYLLKVREYGDTVWKTEGSFYLAATNPAFGIQKLKDYLDVPPMADFRVTVTGNTAVSHVVVHLEAV